MVFVRLVNSVLCEIAMYFEWKDADAAYSGCLELAVGEGARQECYDQLIVAIGESALDYVSCLF